MVYECKLSRLCIATIEYTKKKCAGEPTYEYNTMA